MLDMVNSRRNIQTVMEYISGIDDNDRKIAILGHLVDRLKFQIVAEHRAELESFVRQYKQKEEEVVHRQNELGGKIAELRRRLRSGEIDNRQYQSQLAPLKREKRRAVAELDVFGFRKMYNLFPECPVTIGEVEQYLEELRQWEQRCLEKGMRLV